MINQQCQDTLNFSIAILQYMIRVYIENLYWFPGLLGSTLVPQNFLPQASRICPVTSNEVHLLRTNNDLGTGRSFRVPVV